MSCQLLVRQSLVSRFSVTSEMNLSEKQKEVANDYEELLKRGREVRNLQCHGRGRM